MIIQGHRPKIQKYMIHKIQNVKKVYYVYCEIEYINTC